MQRATAWRPVRLWQAGTCLAWCAFVAWWSFGRDERIPLLAFVNLGFHELGHFICYLVPFVGTVVTASAGTVAQCAVPIGLAVYFLALPRDRLAAAACLAWAAGNFQEAAVYIADAPFERLQLIGGEHDWAALLSPEHLNRMDDAGAIAGAVRGTGAAVLVAAVALCVFALAAPGSDSAPGPPGSDGAVGGERPGPRAVGEVDERFLV